MRAFRQRAIKLLPQRSVYPSVGLRKSVEKPKLKCNALPSVKTAGIRQLPRVTDVRLLIAPR
jgi:hypothetical protein